MTDKQLLSKIKNNEYKVIKPRDESNFSLMAFYRFQSTFDYCH